MSTAPTGPQRPAERDPLLGRVIDGRYRVTTAIARGGMSRVYQAEQAPLGRVVALKVLTTSGEGDQDREFRQRFQLEASACSRLTHPNTVRVFDHGAVGNELLYIAMEYLDGRTLHQVIRLEAPLAAARVVNIAKQVCGSLREAHGMGLLHRDLKPANVVLLQHGDDEDFVKVLDFGLVKQLRVDDELTGTDAVVGSPSYMSPEQIRAERLDARSDIYSLGVILYACITGRAPFVSDTSVGVLLAHLNQPPPPLDPSAPVLQACPTLQWVVETCLAKRPDDRFASVDELLRALRVCEAELRGEQPPTPAVVGGKVVRHGEPVPVPPPSGPTTPVVGEPSASTIVSAIKSRKLPILAATGAVATLAFLAGMVVVAGVGAWWFSQRESGVPAVVNTTPPAAPGVHVTTVPPGARLWRGSVELGPAPADIVVPEGESWTLTARAPGFADTDFDLRWDTSRRQVVLKPDVPAATSRASSSASTGTSGGAERPPTAAAAVSAPTSAPGATPAARAPGANASAPPAEAVPSEAASTATPAPAPAEPSQPKKKPSSDLRDPWEQ